MLKNGQAYFKNFVNTAIFLKYVWPFFNIMKERIEYSRGALLQPSLSWSFSSGKIKKIE